MIKHMVLWRFFDSADGRSKTENMQIAKRLLEDMKGKVPGLGKMEVGVNFNPSCQASDLVLYAEFDSREDLEVYQSHTEHQKVKNFLTNVREERRVVDYEI